MSRTWNQLLDQLETKRSWGHRLFEQFIRWYQPRLQAYGLVMSRRDEYEADTDAAGVTSPESMGAALVRRSDELVSVELTDEYLEMVRSAMANDERVVRLWVARKAAAHLPDYPMLIFLVEPKWWRGKWTGATAGLPREVMCRVDVGGWVHLYVVELGASTKWMAERMERVEGSLVFERAP